MDLLDTQEFIDFFESFRDEYYFSITEISRAKTGKKQPLISSDFRMFSLDDMCKRYSRVKKHLPKTVDAVHFENRNGKLTLYLIEFKNFSMKGSFSTYNLLDVLYNKLEEKNRENVENISDGFLKQFDLIRNHFVDSIEFDLRIKPLETILVSLPWLYEEYCKDKKIPIKDFRAFLECIDIKLIVFINRYSPYRNVSANRLSAHKIDNALKNQYNRLFYSGVIVFDRQRILSHDCFDYFIKREGLTEIF
ncbi:hypothetical protein [Methanobrevibacter sp.]|uniref:hypothetical protein n=1 Tax=Methanobrevibacter sp. TaxID=66852 RepID=UPI00388E9F5A